MSNINERLAMVRKLAGLTLAAFGERIGYDQSTVSRVERGKPPYEGRADDRYIIAVSRAHHVSETWLRTGEGEMYAVPPGEDPDESRVRWALGLFSQLTPAGQRQVLQIAREIVRVGEEKEGEEEK